MFGTQISEWINEIFEANCFDIIGLLWKIFQKELKREISF